MIFMIKPHFCDYIPNWYRTKKLWSVEWNNSKNVWNKSLLKRVRIRFNELKLWINTTKHLQCNIAFLWSYWIIWKHNIILCILENSVKVIQLLENEFVVGKMHNKAFVRPHLKIFNVVPFEIYDIFNASVVHGNGQIKPRSQICSHNECRWHHFWKKNAEFVDLYDRTCVSHYWTSPLINKKKH